jgi:hypothetical protein
VPIEVSPETLTRSQAVTVATPVTAQPAFTG